jgi:hypothetical protein
MPCKHPLTIAGIYPSSFRNIKGFSSLRVIMNSNAAFRTSSFSSSASSSLLPSSSESTCGNENEKCGVGKGRAMVWVGPGSWVCGGEYAAREENEEGRWVLGEEVGMTCAERRKAT